MNYLRAFRYLSFISEALEIASVWNSKSRASKMNLVTSLVVRALNYGLSSQAYKHVNSTKISEALATIIDEIEEVI